MIQDARELSGSTPLQSKLCVIGSGLAGILVALELEGLGHDVLLLEAGNKSRDKQQRAAQAGEVSDGEHEPVEDVSTRRLGGAMALWGGRLLPLDPVDFEPHVTRPEHWPIRYDELEPYYRLANERLDAGAFEYDARRSLSNEAPLFQQLAASESVSEHKTWRWCAPLRFSHFRKRLADSKRIRVVYNALVTELRLDVNHARVERALVASSPQKRFEVRADQFVLAGGGLEIARLLLASRNQRSHGLGNERRHVGRHYMTHPVTEVGLLTVDPALAVRLCTFDRGRDGIYTRRLLSLSDRARTEHGLVNLNLTFWSPDPHDPIHGSGILSAYALTKRLLIRYRLTSKVAGAHRSNLAREPALVRHLSNVVATAPETARTLAQWSRQRWLSARSIPALINAGHAGRVRLRLDAEQRDDAGNFVKLDAERDAFGVPRLRVHYHVHERDRNSYYASLQLIAAELTRSAAAGAQLTLPSREEFVKGAALGDGTHQMGLTRMASSAADGVVDADGCVHSCPNLFIASTAVFPTTGAAPPTLTLAALALRLAKHLDKQLRASAGVS